MVYIFTALLIFSLLLIIVSFFLPNPYKSLLKEVEQLTLQQWQEIYQIKKKLKVFEEELLMDMRIGPVPESETVADKVPKKKEIHEIIKNQIWSLAQQGIPVAQIAKQSSLSVSDVQLILLQGEKRP
ncbi:hypothetical protein J9303_08855 [Bacillaceae bacterium Marseille-Q3522]|nr:hypothetical protein [Bacillaceae bacterium Marseille-Q3522]